MSANRGISPPATRSLAVPIVLALAAPLAVILCIEILHSVWWTLAVYQLGICLVAPAVESRRAGRGLREHAVMLGLAPPGRRALALALGAGTLLVTGAFLVATGGRFLDPDRLAATVAGWGVAPAQLVAMLAIMAVLNAAAEELFWRGYLPGRVAAARSGSSPSPMLSVVAPAILYASYHAVTIGRLVEPAAGAVLMSAGVLAAGLFWGWLRRRTASVWPALLSHWGAVIAYLAVHAWITGAMREM